MDIVIAGGHGKVAMCLHPILVGRGHKVRGLIRNPAQADDLRAAGVEPVLCDLEQADDISDSVGRADAVIFAAGAGPGSDTARKRSMDRDGAIKLIIAANANGIRRYLMISTFHADSPRGPEKFQIYMRAKAEADAVLRASGLAYTIIRPGRLTDDPGTGLINLGPWLKGADVPRDDVAALLAACLEDDRTISCQWEATGGDTPIAEAIDAAAKFDSK
jgi:uncharacterized protein YbjT (DUF2867 family)